MSVLIKGMEMPKAGQVIEIAQNVDGKTFARVEPSFDPWHEIIEVPTPHGRLIAADKLERDIEQYHLSDGKFQHWVQVQNTIIEAEEDQKNESCR